ncbi:MAG: DUF1553 domain-containing protein, partial [Verrucomicrobiales bacterium]|nr:DUF1553 domain-containing protein [Verrucomicrobiales bacterium]
AVPRPTRPAANPWPANEVDAFILAGLQARGLSPAPLADARARARRLSFALTGLPPSPEVVETFASNPSPDAYARLVQAFLASPHFGERWARHWLDVVHYADTHGYEWDTPAKNAWRYRDYVIRAFNQDLSVQRFLLEQLAGDLLEPRIDPETGLNASLMGPMALRLGERRHGDNAAAEGVTQEAMANIIDTVGKGFLGTTVACAQCHDHKLDAVEQRDYYAMAGMWMSTRWYARTLDAKDSNAALIEELRQLKRALRSTLAQHWLHARDAFADKVRQLPPPPTNGVSADFPETLKGLWYRSREHPISREAFLVEQQARIAANRAHLTLLADFTRENGAPGWRWDGAGFRHGLVRDGEPVIAETGPAVLVHLLPAGRWSHVWSMRLAGALRSPFLHTSPPLLFSAELAGGHHAAEAFILDHAFHSERMQFLDVPLPAWRTLKAGDFDTLEGGLDGGDRRVYLEWATKSLNNYFPPRTGYGGVKESDLHDESSWFGVTRIWRHPAGNPPRDELRRFEPVFEDPDPDWARRIARRILTAVERWRADTADAEDVRILNEALSLQLLDARAPAGSELETWVGRYRSTAARLQPDTTMGSVAEWEEGRDEHIGVRGSYTTLGDEVARGNIRFLGGPAERTCTASSGRLEFARNVVDNLNPLTARVFVNRVWLHLFGEGLVRTPDDFGHLGEKPSHPELLDFLAAGFTAEGWSLKRLITRLVTSTTWQQDSRTDAQALEVDPENRLWHHMPLRRLDAEAIRDSLLAASGRLDPTLFGPPIDPPRTSEDAAKRLFSGPLDGHGRRSLYTKVTLMEPPRFLALFNQPIPKLTTGRRDVTSVPNQALALLNDPFVVAMARHWGDQVIHDGATTLEARLRAMFFRALSRPAAEDEIIRLVRLAQRSATLRGLDVDSVMDQAEVWQDVAHALFNLKEFIHVR